MWASVGKLLAPRLCAGCGDANPWGFCRSCLHRLRPVAHGSVCFLCRREYRRRDRLAGLDCRRSEHRWARGRAGFWMESPLDAAIHHLKYRRCQHLGRLLGRRLARAVPLKGSWRGMGVPMTAARRRDRGYNQSDVLLDGAADLWVVTREWGGLSRTRQRRPQAELNLEDRAANIRGNFTVAPGASLIGADWLVVDDVATTGATMAALLQEMRAAGAGRVLPVVLALA